MSVKHTFLISLITKLKFLELFAKLYLENVFNTPDITQKQKVQFCFKLKLVIYVMSYMN